MQRRHTIPGRDALPRPPIWSTPFVFRFQAVLPARARGYGIVLVNRRTIQCSVLGTGTSATPETYRLPAASLTTANPLASSLELRSSIVCQAPAESGVLTIQ